MRKHWLGLGASIILGMIFLVSGIGKLLLQDGDLFETYFPGFLDFLSLDLTRLLYHGLPYVETAIGVLLVLGIAIRLVATVTSVLIAGFIASNIWFINNGMALKDCGCLGLIDSFFQSKLSTQQSLYIDFFMLALLVIIFLFYKRKYNDIRPWFLKRKISV